MSASSIGAAAPQQHHAQPKTENTRKEPAKPAHHETKPAPPPAKSAHKVDVKA